MEKYENPTDVGHRQKTATSIPVEYPEGTRNCTPSINRTYMELLDAYCDKVLYYRNDYKTETLVDCMPDVRLNALISSMSSLRNQEATYNGAQYKHWLIIFRTERERRDNS